MEDLAPVEPARAAARLWCGGMGAVFVALGALLLAGVRPEGWTAAIPCLLIGAVALVAAIAKVPYRRRATAMVVLGLVAGPVGLHGTAVVSAVGGLGWGTARMAAAIALAAALLFRAQYRAYAGARVFLAIAFLAALPFLAFSVIDLARGPIGTPQIGAVVALATAAACLSGFMGAQTTGAGTFLAPAVVVGFTSELVLRALGVHGGELGGSLVARVAVTAAGFLAASALGALGIFQLLASRFAADARRIDLHSPPSEEALPESKRGDGDWSASDT